MPLGSETSSRSAMASVSSRLISSGIVRSKLRRPASTWATGMPSLTAASAQATVLLTSPKTTVPARTVVHQVRFVPLDDAGRLRAVRAGADVEMHVGRGYAEFFEEHVGHRRVVVLAGVDDSKRDAAVCVSRPRTTGASFMKFGRAPATRSRMGIIGRLSYQPSSAATAPRAVTWLAALRANGATIDRSD